MHVSLTVSPIYDIANKLVGASKVARDITAATLANAALREIAGQAPGAAFRIAACLAIECDG